jgi:phosphatidate cytidylyltransferase
MAQPLARADLSDLATRLLSAAVLLPLALAAIWWGRWYFGGLVILLAGAMCWEWSSLCKAKLGPTVLIFAIVISSVFFTFGGAYREALICVALGTLVLAVLARNNASEAPVLLPLGAVYLSMGVVSIVWLRMAEQAGLALFVWMVTIVIATDVGAYFAGRAIGGRKLAPRLSPGKTWSGLMGGIAGAVIFGVVAVKILKGNNYVLVGVLSGVLAVIAQGGDLIESAMKRHFGVKDAGNLIPGHGGALDRFDGFLTVAPATVLMTWVAGRSPLEWQ